jgi:hypothetical protein
LNFNASQSQIHENRIQITEKSHERQKPKVQANQTEQATDERANSQNPTKPIDKTLPKLPQTEPYNTHKP